MPSGDIDTAQPDWSPAGSLPRLGLSVPTLVQFPSFSSYRVAVPAKMALFLFAPITRRVPSEDIDVGCPESSFEPAT